MRRCSLLLFLLCVLSILTILLRPSRASYFHFGIVRTSATSGHGYFSLHTCTPVASPWGFNDNGESRPIIVYMYIPRFMKNDRQISMAKISFSKFRVEFGNNRHVYRHDCRKEVQANFLPIVIQLIVQPVYKQSVESRRSFVRPSLRPYATLGQWIL